MDHSLQQRVLNHPLLRVVRVNQSSFDLVAVSGPCLGASCFFSFMVLSFFALCGASLKSMGSVGLVWGSPFLRLVSSEVD